MAILEENQDVLSDQIQKTLNSVNLTYAETNTHRLLLRSLQKDVLQGNNTVHQLSKELKYFFMAEFLYHYVSIKKSFSNTPKWNKFSQNRHPINFRSSFSNQFTKA